MTSTTDNRQPEQLVYNPFDATFRSNPYPFYRRMREEEPIHESPLGFTVLTRYADCAMMLRHPAVSNDSRKSENFREEMRTQGLDPDEVILNSTPPFLFTDPPDHTRLRGLVSKAFTPRVVETLRPRAQSLVDDLIDAAATKGSLDVIEDLAYPLPVTIISEMLGVPAEDHPRFSAWSRELARSLDPDFVLPPEVLERRIKASEEFSAYFADLIAKRRAEPRDDLVSALIAAEDEGQHLSENELLATCILLLVAGHETTVNLIGNGALALLQNPDQLQRLREEPTLIKTAVEELLRYDAPVQLTGRTPLHDIELDGHTLPKDRSVILLLAAANRDPAQFPGPERLDIGRQDNRHLAFGLGIHFCLGAPLARVEGQIALAAIANRLDGVRLATDTPAYKENVTLRGLAALPVAFDRVR